MSLVAEICCVPLLPNICWCPLITPIDYISNSMSERAIWD